MRKDTNHWPEMDKKWQEEWERAGLFHRQIDLQKPKLYILDMFPYPSANGLHVGHLGRIYRFGYSISLLHYARLPCIASDGVGCIWLTNRELCH